MARTTDLTIAITLATKKATLTGQIAVREKANLIVTGFGTAAAADLVVCLIFDKVLIAKTQGLTTGTSYTGVLDLNTEEAVAAFGDTPANTKIKCSLVIYDITNQAMLVNDFVYVMQNPYNTDMEAPVAVDPIGDVLYAPISKGVDNGNSHDHVGGDGAQIDHTGLSNIGTNTHAQIDTELAKLAGTTALGNFRYSTSLGLWCIRDVDDPTLWHSIQAAGGASSGFLVVGNGATIS